MSTFAVGEVAIYWRPGLPNHKVEVTIKSELIVGRVWNQDRWEMTVYHRIDSPAFSAYHRSLDPCATLDELRKRRPPQDWIAICNLRDAPVERPKEVA